MPEITIRQMFEVGVHFGHQTRYWNPKMEPYILGSRNKIHIIDLDKSLPLLNEALNKLRSIAEEGGKILFVGTKRAAGKLVKKHATRCGMPYIDHRWLGGTLTNFRTVKQSVKRYINLEEEYENTKFANITKKVALGKVRDLKKLERALQGIKEMNRQPQALFVIDVRYERISINEAKKLGIPVIAIVDTNNLLEGIDYPIPGNDDAIRAIELYTSAVADVILEGKENTSAEVGEYVEDEDEDQRLPNVGGQDTVVSVKSDKKSLKGEAKAAVSATDSAQTAVPPSTEKVAEDETTDAATDSAQTAVPPSTEKVAEDETTDAAKATK